MTAIRTLRMPLLLLLLVALSLAACDYLPERDPGQGNATPTAETAPNGEDSAAGDVDQTAPADAETASADTGPCANQYYPVGTEQPRHYKISGSAPSEYVLTHEKKADDSFTEIRRFPSGLEVKTNFVCTDEGLRNVEYNSVADFSAGNFKMETLESSGVTLPKEWEVGKKWETSYKIRGKLKAGPVSADANGTVTLDNELEALGEKVSTPAGEFEAARVATTINMNLNVGRPVKLSMTNWYAPDVGLVKQETNSPFGGRQNVVYTGVKEKE